MSDTATVEALTAEVRALVVGSRQITLSVFRQLDTVGPDFIEPFGRVRDKPGPGELHVVGRERESGALVRSFVWADEEAAIRHLDRNTSLSVYGSDTLADLESRYRHHRGANVEALMGAMETFELDAMVAERWRGLPLIVLAGLK